MNTKLFIDGYKREQDRQNPEYLMEKLNCTYEEARDVIAYDAAIEEAAMDEPVEGEIVVERPAPKKKGGISQEELDEMKVIILATFKYEAFQNKHVSGEVGDKMGLSSRQTPSRLKRLAEEGFLVEVEPSEVKLKGRTSSKAYRAVEE